MIHNHIVLFISICAATYVLIAGGVHGVGEAAEAEFEFDGEVVPWEVVSTLWPIFLTWKLLAYSVVAAYYAVYYPAATVSRAMGSFTKRITGRKKPLPKASVVKRAS